MDSVNTNGVHPSSSDGRDGYGQAFTDMIINATGPKASPRLRTVIADLTQHLHDFCRNNAITTEEWLMALEFINEAGRMSDAKRNEGQLLCGVLALETLLDRMGDGEPTPSASVAAPTASNLLGPFYQSDSPLLSNGSNIVLDDSGQGRRVHMRGRVLDSRTQEPIVGALVDVWHSNADGIYAQQDPKQPYFNLRGKFHTDSAGNYDLYCSVPSAYSIPDDGPAGQLLRLLDRHPMRPAHIHCLVTADQYVDIVTELFDSQSDYLRNDSMYSVKNDLIVEFVPITNDEKADFELKFDFKMRRKAN